MALTYDEARNLYDRASEIKSSGRYNPKMRKELDSILAETKQVVDAGDERQQLLQWMKTETQPKVNAPMSKADQAKAKKIDKMYKDDLNMYREQDKKSALDNLGKMNEMINNTDLSNLSLEELRRAVEIHKEAQKAAGVLPDAPTNNPADRIGRAPARRGGMPPGGDDLSMPKGWRDRPSQRRSPKDKITGDISVELNGKPREKVWGENLDYQGPDTFGMF